MTAELTAWVMTRLAEHGPAAVFLGVFIDTFLLPFPSQLVVLAAGALIIEPGLCPGRAFVPILLRIVVPGTLGLTLGAFFPYGVAYWGGKPTIDRFQGMLGFGWDDAEALGSRLKSRAGLMIFVSRTLLVVPLTLISAAAGILRMSVPRFTAWTILGSVPRCLLLGYLGYLFRDAYQRLAAGLGTAQAWTGAGALVLILAAAAWLGHRRKRKAA
ncbi:MAG: VTT domain-containing protein [Elusimicrobia bacterium]|nr:VTT domain-containing protein [Elusimicrobiota bacterium]